MKSTAYRSVPLVAFAAAVLLLGLWPALASQADGITASTLNTIHSGFDGDSTEFGNAPQERGQARSSSSSSTSSRASSSRSSSGSSRGSSSTGSSGSSSSSSGSSTSSTTSSDSSSGSSRSSASSSRGSSSSSRGSSARSSSSSSSSRGSGSSSSARDSASSSSSRSSRGTTTRSSGTRSSSSDSGRSSRGTATTRSSSSDSGRASRGTTTRSSSGDSGRTSRGTTTRTTTSGDSGSYRTDRGAGRTDTGRTDTGRTNTTTGGTSTRTTRDYPGYDRGGRTRTDTPNYTGGGGGTDYRPRLDRAQEDRTDNYRGRRSDRRGYYDHYVYDYPHRSYYCPYDFWYWNFGIRPAGYWAWNWGWDPFYSWGWDAGWPHYNYGYTSPTVFWSANVGWGVQANVAFPIHTPYYRYHDERSNLGGIDLNVNPQDAGVYLNGQYIGVVDEFNGWPGYLWLEEGTYHLVVYKEGYETLSREYTIQRGVVLNVRDRMSIGIATHPDEVPVPPRVRYEIEAQRQAEEDRLAERDSSEDEWRQRAAEYLARRDAEQYEGDSGSRSGNPGGILDARVAPARLNIDAVPADASVYLDGAFLGTAADLASRGGVLVDPGNHVLELVRPGYDSKQRSFTVEAGDQLQLNLQLEKANEEGVAVSLAP